MQCMLYLSPVGREKIYIHISISLFVNLACIAVGVEMVGLMACQCKCAKATEKNCNNCIDNK